MKSLVGMFFKLVRAVVGPLLLTWDRLTTPKGITRPVEEQQRIDRQTRDLVLYQFRSCPFCIKTRRAIKRLSLDIAVRDALRDADSRRELLEGGGQIKVPCLKIAGNGGQTTWMYESSDIIRYLQERFS